jgi:predicted nucleic acid-binding Zn ribbon protein
MTRSFRHCFICGKTLRYVTSTRSVPCEECQEREEEVG